MATRERLQLSYDQGLLGGVCAGIAKWLGWKPVVVRIFFVVLYRVGGVSWRLGLRPVVPVDAEPSN